MADSFSLHGRRHSLGHVDRLTLALAPDGCDRTVLPGEQYASLKRPWSMAARPSIMLEGYRPPPEAKIGPRPKCPSSKRRRCHPALRAPSGTRRNRAGPSMWRGRSTCSSSSGHQRASGGAIASSSGHCAWGPRRAGTGARRRRRWAMVPLPEEQNAVGLTRKRMKPSIYWLFVFIPVTVILEHGGNVPAPVIFFSAALAIVPIAALIVQSTEQVASRTGDAVGGLLNATFGNAPELIIAVVALRAGHLDMVRASLVGAILANLLLALGAAFFLGGLRHREQSYNPTAARTYSTMMLLATISLVVPSAFSRYFAPEGTIREEKMLNLGIA